MLKREFSRIQAELIMVFVAFIWGATFVVVKNALADIGPFIFLGIRFLLAFLVLLAMTYGNMTQMRWATVKAGCLLGFFLFIGYIFQTLGLQYTSSSNAGFITGMSVVLVPLIYCLINRHLPGIITTITIVLAAAGLYLLSAGGAGLDLSKGDLLELVCAFGFAFHIVFVDRHSFQHNAVAITGVQILFVGILCMIIGLFTEPLPANLSMNVVNAIVITSVFATSLAFLMQNYLQKFSTPTRVAVVLTTEPVFAALTGYFGAGEVLSRAGFLGSGMILAAMLIAILSRSNPGKLLERIGQ